LQESYKELKREGVKEKGIQWCLISKFYLMDETFTQQKQAL